MFNWLINWVHKEHGSLRCRRNQVRTMKSASPNRFLQAVYFQLFAVLWAALAFLLALQGWSRTNSDARWFVGAFTVLGPLCAIGSAVLIHREILRWAGVFLVLSAATPTYFAWPLNVLALLVGLLLIGGMQLTASYLSEKSYVPILDFPPDTPTGNLFTILLLTVGNLVLPFVSYVWGTSRVLRTTRWSGWQKVSLILLLPFLGLGGTGAAKWGRRTTMSCVTRPGFSCSNVVIATQTTLSPVRSPNAAAGTQPSEYHLGLVGRTSVSVGEKFLVQQTPNSSIDDMRGGYYWLSAIPSAAKAHRALLWSEKIQGGVPGGSTNSKHWDMLAFGVFDPGPDTLILPADISTANYQLCTASSLHEACMSLVVSAEK
jgi:hypothetical protein